MDVVLVGDSGGHDRARLPLAPCPSRSTRCSCSPRAVRRGLKTPLLVGDLPFGSYEVSDEQAVATAQRFIKEAGCDAVKLERGGSSVERAARDRGRRHPGDGPRGPHAPDRHGPRRLPLAGPHGRARARGVRRTRWRWRRPAASRSCSRRSPRDVTDLIMPRLEIPVIGIGAGPATDGQVLVFHDLLGIYDGHAARFVKRYADVRDADDRRASARSPRTCARGATPSPSTATRWRRTSASGSRRCSGFNQRTKRGCSPPQG